MIGPGKYDKQAESCLHETAAQGVVLMVLGGNKGQGFSVVAQDKNLVLGLPDLLRQMADQIDKDTRGWEMN